MIATVQLLHSIGIVVIQSTAVCIFSTDFKILYKCFIILVFTRYIRDGKCSLLFHVYENVLVQTVCRPFLKIFLIDFKIKLTEIQNNCHFKK